MTTIIGIIGLGFVGSAMYNSFTKKGITNLFGYDKYKNGGIGSFENMINCDIIFLALPTKYDSNIHQYDKSAIIDTCDKLQQTNYKGVIVIKSTVEPTTTNRLSKKYPTLSFIHNPEFLTARTAYEDFHNQKYIVLGRGLNCTDKKYNMVLQFFKKHYDATISLCTSLESESMKIFCNSFYAVKVQFFTEIYKLCQTTGCDYNRTVRMMINNNWINPMHTQVPGSDGQISYGGLCFPKDTNALNELMKRNKTPNQVLQSTINERNQMRDDNLNCK
jgi:nucleotide sugar dehydrogenase